eukprot:SAG11_NODE_720_length_7550_cov_12.284257_5_plen_51_part_00
MGLLYENDGFTSSVETRAIARDICSVHAQVAAASDERIDSFNSARTTQLS